MLGIDATATIVASARGKNVAIKMRKMAGLSPIWNQRIAKGIHAKGERKRKKFNIGTKALRALSFRPSQSPSGIPNKVATLNPMATRHKDATISFRSLPDVTSSSKLINTAFGDGRAYAGNRSM